MVDHRATKLVIGRDPQCDVVLDFPEVSRQHARLTISNGQAVLEDLRSTNGTFVNGRRVTRVAVTQRDLIQIGRETFLFDGGSVRCHQQGLNHPMRVDVVGLAQTVGRDERVILQEVSFSVLPGELVAIVGPSGSGKTTLLKALTGVAPGVRGAVFLNGVSFYEHPLMFRTALGYVPQDDIVHRDLSVEQALRYTLRLRFGERATEAEAETQISAVLSELDLALHRAKRVKNLSGGQRKRVNVAIELIGKPALLVLDEPTTGLDPHLERDFIQLCQRMSSNGRTIVLTTHSNQALALCDLALIVAPDGYLAFYGPPREALRFFNVSDFPDIYATLQQGQVPAREWAGRYARSNYHQKYVQERLATRPNTPTNSNVDERDPFFDFRQFVVLVRRYLDVMFADRVNTSVLLLQAPVIAVVLALLFPTDSFTGSIALDHLNFGGRVVFLLTISAIWFGTINAAREIVKEIAIYQRERMAALPIGSYLGSKAAVLGTLCLIQVLALILVLGARTAWFDSSFLVIARIFVILGLAAFAAMGMGLAVSAIASSSDQAISVTPVILIAQIALSGMFISPDDLNLLMRMLSKLTVAHWGFAAVGGLVDLNGRLARIALDAPFVRQAIFDQPLLLASGALVVLTTSFLILTELMLHARERT